MKKQLLSLMAFCAACLVLGAQAQSSSGGTSDTSGSTSGSSSGSSSDTSGSTGGSSGSMGGTSGSESGWMSRHMGGMGHHEVKASQLTGAQISDSSGSQLGTISDTIINPASGRLDFAVISLSSGSKQVAVPWMLLRPASTGATGSTGTAGQQPSFTFAGDSSKLQSAPTFDPNADLNQPSWRQSVFSYFGLTGGAGTATGGAETPGGGTSGGTSPTPGGSSDTSGGSSGSSTPNPSSSGNQ